MKRYLEHIKSKPPHERRQHAAQISAGIVAVVFVVWISTIGLRFASTPSQTAGGDNNQLANIVSGTGSQNATLIIATTSQGY
jgi:hypothetical protein